jgi:hypothetical protein
MDNKCRAEELAARWESELLIGFSSCFDCFREFGFFNYCHDSFLSLLLAYFHYSFVISFTGTMNSEPRRSSIFLNRI